MFNAYLDPVDLHQVVVIRRNGSTYVDNTYLFKTAAEDRMIELIHSFPSGAYQTIYIKPYMTQDWGE